MKTFEEIVLNRKSVRNFTDDIVKKEDLDKIIEFARTAPNYVNGQQITVLYTQDKEKIEKIAELTGGQPQVRNSKVFFVIVADFNRAKNLLEKEGLELTDDIHRLREIGMMDAGIVASYINLASESLGYGGTIIGGVQANPEKIGALFNIPENVYVMVGVTLGIPNEASKTAPVKPKISKEAFANEDKYNHEAQEKESFEYEIILNEWFNSIGVKQPLHREVIKRYFSKK